MKTLLLILLASPCHAALPSIEGLMTGDVVFPAGSTVTIKSNPAVVSNSSWVFNGGSITMASSSTTFVASATAAGFSVTGDLVTGANAPSVFGASVTFNSNVNYAINSTSTIQGEVMYGIPTTASFTTGTGVQGYWMKSMDGATQAAGCFVVLGLNTMAFTTPSDPSTMVFSSTITSLANGPFGVLLESCAPLQICRVATKGLVKATVRTSSITQGNSLSTFTTRCQATSNSPGASASAGCGMSSESSNTAWVLLGCY